MFFHDLVSVILNQYIVLTSVQEVKYKLRKCNHVFLHYSQSGYLKGMFIDFYLLIFYFGKQAAEQMVKFQLRHGNDLLAMDSLRDCDVRNCERCLQKSLFKAWPFQTFIKINKYIIKINSLCLINRLIYKNKGGYCDRTSSSCGRGGGSHCVMCSCSRIWSCSVRQGGAEAGHQTAISTNSPWRYATFYFVKRLINSFLLWRQFTLWPCRVIFANSSWKLNWPFYWSKTINTTPVYCKNNSDIFFRFLVFLKIKYFFYTPIYM